MLIFKIVHKTGDKIIFSIKQNYASYSRSQFITELYKPSHVTYNI